MAMSPELDAVQKAILDIHRELFDESPSPMKLQKLCYYAQGYALAEGKPLFKDDFQAWQHGPVVPDMYQEYKDLKWRPIAAEVEPPKMEPQVIEHLEGIVAAYGRYDGAALSTMTHRERPWASARGDLPETANSEATISKDTMERFFARKLRGEE
ncbi:hypothetical protein GmRootV213_05660 [Variovorax sp. V213]|uniref:Panacea domain-containing protein n=1 Tax=Variovorax sp. V213 TaxID=3065955 RepID=UPI0034E83BF5